MKIKYLPALLILSFLASCSSLKPESFQGSEPQLDLMKFFAGHTHSSGVMEERNGKPSENIITKTTGTFANGVLNMEQDVIPENSKKSHRSFKLKRIDDHHVESTGSDISGKTIGTFYCNYFTWGYRLKLSGKGLVKHVNIKQYMYLMEGGKTLIVRSVFRKFGVIVTEITEQFHKDD
ncbi:DUF3833 family protein [Pedobacter sp. SD-b]|uniref:DUF3833 family protein n=1 Tax=Pedobacter segetis TaxID=2793069 RepID=A0ABS1BMR5_9SPHI|nr:DUF3833 family protein [Pedobacter segetis]MBK0384187.1 DUF3833 family protein [Pedobacter segetis]